jgi:hypothetical protein
MYIKLYQTRERGKGTSLLVERYLGTRVSLLEYRIRLNLVDLRLYLHLDIQGCCLILAHFSVFPHKQIGKNYLTEFTSKWS